MCVQKQQFTLAKEVISCTSSSLHMQLLILFMHMQDSRAQLPAWRCAYILQAENLSNDISLLKQVYGWIKLWPAASGYGSCSQGLECYIEGKGEFNMDFLKARSRRPDCPKSILFNFSVTFVVTSESCHVPKNLKGEFNWEVVGLLRKSQFPPEDSVATLPGRVWITLEKINTFWDCYKV